MSSQSLEPFGFTSGPVVGSEPVYVSEGGNRSKTVVIMVHDRRYRIEVAAGECAIYNKHGDSVHIKDDRSIVVKSALKVRLETTLVECSENLKVFGDAEILGTAFIDVDAVIGGKSYLLHKHPETGVQTLVPV